MLLAGRKIPARVNIKFHRFGQSAICWQVFIWLSDFEKILLYVSHYTKSNLANFGAWVEIENEAGEIKAFRIVGPDEIYGDAKGYISIDSPMARALLKKEVDDEFSVKTPEGYKEWFVNTIRYSAE